MGTIFGKVSPLTHPGEVCALLVLHSFVDLIYLITFGQSDKCQQNIIAFPILGALLYTHKKPVDSV